MNARTLTMIATFITGLSLIGIHVLSWENADLLAHLLGVAEMRVYDAASLALVMGLFLSGSVALTFTSAE